MRFVSPDHSHKIWWVVDGADPMEVIVPAQRDCVPLITGNHSTRVVELPLNWCFLGLIR